MYTFLVQPLQGENIHVCLFVCMFRPEPLYKVPFTESQDHIKLEFSNINAVSAIKHVIHEAIILRPAIFRSFDSRPTRYEDVEDLDIVNSYCHKAVHNQTIRSNTAHSQFVCLLFQVQPTIQVHWLTKAGLHQVDMPSTKS